MLSLKVSCPLQISSIPDKIITWGHMHVKEGSLSVASHGRLTGDSEIIILGILTNQKEYKNISLG